MQVFSKIQFPGVQNDIVRSDGTKKNIEVEYPLFTLDLAREESSFHKITKIDDSRVSLPNLETKKLGFISLHARADLYEYIKVSCFCGGGGYSFGYMCLLR